MTAGLVIPRPSAPAFVVTPEQRLQLTVTLLRETWVRELDGHPNDAPRIREYQAVTGNAPPDSWCMSFVLWGVNKVWGRRTGLPFDGRCQIVRLAAARMHWLKYGPPRVGDIGFVIDRKRDHAHHTFVVTGAPRADGAFPTCEGNTNPNGGSEGYGVFCRKRGGADDSTLYEFIRFPTTAA